MKARNLRAFIVKTGLRGLAELMFHPVLLPLLAITAWLRSLWAARVLLYGQWGRYQGFHPLNAINSLYYKTQWLNIDRYGFRGISPVVGLGNYPLSNWFHLSALSSCLYGSAGAMVTLLGTIFWVFMHAIWFWVVQWHWVLIVLAVLFFSSTAYLMAFVRQNYNILGWLWLPLGIFGVMSNQLGLAAVAWFAASLGSITAVFVAGPLVMALAVSDDNYYLLLTLVPALVKLGLHIVPMFQMGTMRTGLTSMAKLIGLASFGVRYQRKSMRLTLSHAYFYAVYGLCCAALWVTGEGLPVLALTAFGLLVVNQTLMRFADEESLVILFCSVMAATVVTDPWDWVALAALVFAVNILPVIFGGSLWKQTRSLVRLAKFEPFDHQPLVESMAGFFAVPEGKRVLFAFEDPGDAYERVFDGYRVLLELPLYVAASKGVHLMPDWYAVAETNHPDAPDFWGRTPERVLDNARRWDADYVIVYQDSGTELDPAWYASFELASEFDWGQWVDYLRGVPLWSAEKPPKWWLLRVR